MAQVIDIGNVIRLKGYFPLIGAVTLFGIGLFVLSRNRKAVVNQLFAAGVLALAGADAAWFASAHSSSPSSILLWHRIILASHIVTLPAWYLYTASFGSADFREGIRRQRFLAWGIGVMSLFFLCLVPTDYVIQGVLVQNNGSILFPLGWAGKALMIASLALSLVVLSNLETTYRHANRETRRKIEFLVLGLFSILGFQFFWLSRTLLNSAILPHSFFVEMSLRTVN